ncbi:MAG: PorT family protein [Bacteroidota bacterium]|nr:PorT family protein [Bacteroidota bacterium]
MKKLFILTVIFLICINTIDAQKRFLAGIKGGLSTSQVAGDTYTGFDKVGLIGGGFVRAKLNEKWTTQFEIIYIQKGSKHNSNPEVGDFDFYLLRLNYIEVPVLFQYHQKKFTFEAGPGFGYLQKVEEFDEFGVYISRQPFINTEISFNFGISYNLFNNFDVTWRYTNSLNALRRHVSGARRWYNPGQQNNVLSFTLSYHFGKANAE